jgi:xylulokinase
VQRREGEKFEDFLEGRWDESGFVRRVAEGYQEGVFERYGEALEGFRELEGVAIQERGEHGNVEGKDAKVDGGVVRAN